MNRIKEVLEQKEIKQTWLAEKLGKAITWSMAMCRTNSNQNWK